MLVEDLAVPPLLGDRHVVTFAAQPQVPEGAHDTALGLKGEIGEVAVVTGANKGLGA